MQFADLAILAREPPTHVERNTQMRPINVRRSMIAALGAAAVVAGTVVPAYAAPVALEEGTPGDAAAAVEQPAAEDSAPATEDPAADDQDGEEGPVASWKHNDKGWWFDLGDGDYAKDEQVEIDDQIYRFDSDGYMVTGWHKEEAGWEYFTLNGQQIFGWASWNGSWYFLSPENGIMQTSWINVDGTWYYLHHSGAMATGWVKLGADWYYLNESGAMVTGWAEINGSWFYMDDNGAMVTGIQTIDGKRHLFHDSGAWAGQL